jgi:hypothetical protein
MHILNHSVSADFYQAFLQLFENSPLHGSAGTITLFTDGVSAEPYAAFTPPALGRPKPLGRAATPEDLFIRVVKALESVVKALERRPETTSGPDSPQHPGPGRWWWLCFVDTRAAEGQQFRGVAVVEGATLRAAIERVAALRIYPGGKVTSVPCTAYVPARRWRDRLLTHSEVIAARNDWLRA